MTFGRRDLDTLSHILAETADREIIPRFRKLGDGMIREKSSSLDLVTDADEAADAAIAAASKKAFPQALFVGEETVERYPDLLTRIAGADLALIIDPIDGTSNFSWGLPLFGMLAAVSIRGETVAGLIYDPIGRDWVMGLKGEGAWHQDAEGKTTDIRAAKPAPVNEMIGTASWYMMPEPLRSKIAGNLSRTSAAFGYRCSAYEYRLICLGHCHFSLHYKLMPWDHAAGLLIHEEAGGYAARYDGSRYRPSQTEGGILAAPDEKSWHELREALFE